MMADNGKSRTPGRSSKNSSGNARLSEKSERISVKLQTPVLKDHEHEYAVDGPYSSKKPTSIPSSLKKVTSTPSATSTKRRVTFKSENELFEMKETDYEAPGSPRAKMRSTPPRPQGRRLCFICRTRYRTLQKLLEHMKEHRDLICT